MGNGYEATAVIIVAAMFFGIWCWVIDKFNEGQ